MSDPTLCLFNQKVAMLRQFFSDCSNPEQRYKKIIELGSILPPMTYEEATDNNLVPGCQSRLYFKASLKGGLFLFTAHSDALISKGLAGLLYKVYNELPPAALLQHPPTFLKDLSISSSLSPSRSNGLMNIYLTMQRNAVVFLTQSSSGSMKIEK